MLLVLLSIVLQEFIQVFTQIVTVKNLCILSKRGILKIKAVWYDCKESDSVNRSFLRCEHQ